MNRHAILSKRPGRPAPIPLVTILLFWLGLVLPQAGWAQVNSTWNGGSGTWSSGFRWTGGNVPNNGVTQFNVLLDNGNSINSTVTLNQDATINSLRIDTGDRLVISNGWDLEIEAGVLFNDGSVEISGINSPAQLILSNGSQITGNGTINLYSNTLSRITSANAGDTFSIGPGQAIMGRGQLGMNLSAIQNDGIVHASGSGTLTVDPGQGGGGFVNNNLMTASNGGTLLLTSGQYNNLNGTILADDGGTVEFSNASVNGGTISQAGTGSVVVRNGTTNTFSGTIENHAAIQFNGINGPAMIRIEDNTSLLGTGSLNMYSNTLDRIQGFNAGDLLINGADHSIVGAGNLGMGRMHLTNHGLIHANLSGRTMTVDPGGGIVNNFGTMLASNGGTLQLNSGNYRNSGVLRSEAGSVVRLMNGANVNGHLETAGDGVIEVGNGQTVSFAGATINDAAMRIGGVNGTTRLLASGNVSFEGTGSIELTSRAYSRLEGGFLNAAGHSIFGVGQIGNGSAIIQNYGTVTTGGSGTLTLDSAFYNSGLVDAGKGTLEIAGSYHQSSQLAVTRINDGWIDNSVTLNFDAGLLEGKGVIAGDVVIDRATLRPGLDGIGSLRFGSLDINNFLADTDLEIGGLAPGVGHDFIMVDGALSLHGDLQLSFVDGFENLISESDQLTLMSSSLLSGYFTNVANGETLFTEDGRGSFQVFYGAGSSYDPNSVVISGFSAIPEPTGVGVLMLISGLTIMKRRRRPPAA